MTRRERQVKQPLRVRLCFFWSESCFWEVVCEGGTTIVGAAEGSCQNATLSEYCFGPNKEYEDELESCLIESRKPDMAVWGDCECVIVGSQNPFKLPLESS